MNTYGDISKYDEQADGSLIVEGIASSDIVDRQGEVVSAEAMREAIPTFMQDPALREMHQPIAAGVPLEMRVQEDGKTFAKVHVVDKGSVAKIKAGVLRGFSIGGSALTKVGNSITRLVLKELSLVDRSCNPECKYTLAKVDTNNKNFMEVSKSDVEKLQASIDEQNKTITALSETVKTLATAKPTSLITKVDGKDVEVSGDAIQGLIAKFDKLTEELTATKSAVTEGERASVIAKMDSEGRAPINPETNVAYKTEELQKMDITVLKVLAVNAPKVPLISRSSLLKMDDKDNPVLDTSVTGQERLEKAWSNIKR